MREIILGVHSQEIMITLLRPLKGHQLQTGQGQLRIRLLQVTNNKFMTGSSEILFFAFNLALIVPGSLANSE